MDLTKLNGVPVSTIQGNAPSAFPKVSPRLSTSSSSGIRAPLTLDSDSDYSVSDDDQKYSVNGYSSDSALESEGFVSGEDEFETVSGRPFVGRPDDETTQKTHLAAKNVVSRISVKSPDEESSITADNDDSNWPDRAQQDEGIIETNYPADQESNLVSIVQVENSSNGSCLLPVRGIPIAKLSMDSDDDSETSEVHDEDSVPGSVRVSGSQVLGRVKNIPKVKVLEVEEDEEDEYQSDIEAESDVFSALVQRRSTNEDLPSSFDKEHTVLDDEQAEVADRKSPAATYEETGHSSLKGKECAISTGESDLLQDAKTIDGETVTLDWGEKQIHIAELDNNTMALDSTYLRGVEVVPLKPAFNRAANIEKPEGQTGQQTDDRKYHGDCTAAEAIQLSNHVIHEAEMQPNDDAGPLESWAGAEYSCLGNETAEGLILERELHDASVSSQLNFSESNFYAKSEFKVESSVTESIKFIEEVGYILPQNECQDSTANDSVTRKQSPVYDGQFLQHLQKVSTKVPSDSTEVDTGGVNEGRKVLGSAAPVALFRDSQTEGGQFISSSGDGTKICSLEDPAGLDSSFNASNLGAQLNHSGFSKKEYMAGGEEEKKFCEEDEKKLVEMRQTVITYMRLVHRLKRSLEDPMAAHVLHQLVTAAGRSHAQAFSFNFSKKEAMELEGKVTDSLNIPLNILVIGKTGVGKSSTINSIIGEEKALTHAFKPATSNVKEIIGILNGLEIRILDTPGLRISPEEQSLNRKILLSIKKFIKRCPPDIVVYVDRVDTWSRDLSDLLILKSVTRYLGPSIWHNAIITLTHATATPPDGPSGSSLSYEDFVTQRSHFLQQLINHSVGYRPAMNPGPLSPVTLVENHPLQINGDGQTMLTNCENWRSQFLLLCYSMKILSEAGLLLKTLTHAEQGKLFSLGIHNTPFLYFSSGLLQKDSRPTLSHGHGGEDVDSDYASDSDEDDDEGYHNLRPIKPLAKYQVATLSEQKKTHVEEYEEPSLQPLPRPIVNVHGWDHDCVCDVVSMEDHPVIVGRFPADITLQIKKDERDQCTLYLDSSVSAKLGGNGSTMMELGIRTLGKQLAYALKGDTEVKNLKRNGAAAGKSATFWGENLVAGIKVEDQVAIRRHLIFYGNAGVTQFNGDAAYGADFEVHLREKDSPIGKDESTASLSIRKWREEVTLGCSLGSQFSVGRTSTIAVHAGLNNKLSGQISVKTRSSDQLQIALLGLLPVMKGLISYLFAQSTSR